MEEVWGCAQAGAARAARTGAASRAPALPQRQPALTQRMQRQLRRQAHARAQRLRPRVRAAAGAAADGRAQRAAEVVGQQGAHKRGPHCGEGRAAGCESEAGATMPRMAWLGSAICGR